jgi:hypothetical protein
MTSYLYKLLIFSLFFLAMPSLYASDLAKEQRWADQIVDSLITGEAEWLPVGKHKVLAIYTESDTQPALGGAIILHGIGVHPDWPDVIHPLRTRLPEGGWSTLSVQMPILPNEATGKDYLPLMDEVTPRIQAAIKFLQQQGISNIVIIAHSLGTSMAGYYLSTHPDSPIHGFVGISMSELDKDPRLSPVAQANKIKLPVLEIYGSLDEDYVISYAKQRKNAATTGGNTNYQQIMIEGANHFYNGKDDILVETVLNWLDSNMVTNKK